MFNKLWVKDSQTNNINLSHNPNYAEYAHAPSVSATWFTMCPTTMLCQRWPHGAEAPCLSFGLCLCSNTPSQLISKLPFQFWLRRPLFPLFQVRFSSSSMADSNEELLKVYFVMGDPTGRYYTNSTVPRITRTHKPLHHVMMAMGDWIGSLRPGCTKENEFAYKWWEMENEMDRQTGGVSAVPTCGIEGAASEGITLDSPVDLCSTLIYGLELWVVEQRAETSESHCSFGPKGASQGGLGIWFGCLLDIFVWGSSGHTNLGRDCVVDPEFIIGFIYPIGQGNPWNPPGAGKLEIVAVEKNVSIPCSPKWKIMEG